MCHASSPSWALACLGIKFLARNSKHMSNPKPCGGQVHHVNFVMYTVEMKIS